MLPVMLGGTKRTYLHVMNAPSGTGAKEVAGWVDKGWIKEVTIDSTFNMDNAIEASLLFPSRLLLRRNAAELTISRHMRN